MSNIQQALAPKKVKQKSHDILSDDIFTTKSTQCIINMLRDEYTLNRYIFVKGSIIRNLLLRMGTSNDEIKKMKTVSEILRGDPTLNYRLTQNGRFCMNNETKTFRRLEGQPFILTKDEDFIRHDSGILRQFRAIQDSLQTNTAFLALMHLKLLLIDGQDSKRRYAQDYNSANWISTIFHTRTVTTAKILGEPAAEGVHCDGVDHTMTTFLGSKNMAPSSAVTQLHDMAQKTGILWDQVDKKFVKATVQHTSFLDTLLIFDNERKHTVSPVFSENVTLPSQRDMLVCFTRKPALPQHASYGYDSLKPHIEMPMEVELLPLT